MKRSTGIAIAVVLGLLSVAHSQERRYDIPFSTVGSGVGLVGDDKRQMLVSVGKLAPSQQDGALSMQPGLWQVTQNLTLPVLVELNGAIQTGVAPRLDWSDVLGATGYGVEYANNPQFAGKIVRSSIVSEYAFTEPLEDGIYYWRVYGVGMNASSKFSPTDSFVIAADRDGTLMVAAGVNEPVPLPTTANAADDAIDVLDFTLKDGGGSDGLPLKVSEVAVHASGTADFGKGVFRLKGPDANQVIGVYDAQAQTLTFSGLGISVDDGQSEIYAISAFFQDNTGLTEGQTFALGLDGNVDLTMVAPTTWMSSANQAVDNGTGSAVRVDATRLVFTTQPGGAVHDQPLATQPVLKAVDAYGNADVDFVGQVGLSVIGGSDLVMTEGLATGVNGVATFSGVVIALTGPERRLTASAQHMQAVTSAPFAVQPAAASVSLSGLQVDYDSTPKSAVVQTQPPDLSMAVTYDGFPDAPVGPGSFQVQAVGTDPNYTGQASGTLVIVPPPPPVAVLQATPIEGNPGFAVTFADASTGYVDGWELKAKTGEDEEILFTGDELKQPVVVTYPNPGTYPAVLTVTGPGGADQATVEIVVHAPPTVVSIEPGTVAEDAVLVLDLSGKDAEPGTWSVEDAAVGLILSAVPIGDVITFTPVGDAHGSDEVRIVRTNEYQLSTAGTVTLTWTPVDDAPAIEPVLEATFTASEDSPIQVGGVAHALDVDTDLETLMWSASGYDGELVASVQEGNGGVTFAPVENGHGTTQATIHLSDPATGKEVTQAVQLTWTPVNDAPKAPVAIYPEEGISGVPLSPVLTWSAEDVDGDPLSYDVTLSSDGTTVMQGMGLVEAQFAVGPLQSGTSYSWKVVARDAQESVEERFSFTTELDRQPPAVSDVRAAATHELATVSWRTDEEATGGLTYRSVPEDGSQPVSGVAEQATPGVAHQVRLSDLLPAMWYEYEVVAVDGAVPGNASAPVGGRFRTLAAPDVDGPVIQVGPYVEGITQESAVVRWTTDELSTSVVRYWVVSGAGNGPATEMVLGDMVDDHLVKLEGLTADTIYGYEVQSLDGAGPNPSVVKSGEPFSTERERDAIPPAFEAGPSVQSVTDLSAVVILKASEMVQVQVRFDADADLSDGRTANSAQVGSEHQIVLTGLTPETEYHYQVTLTDEGGNPFSSGLRSFATPAAPDTRAPGYLVPPGAESVTDVSAVLVLTADEPVRVQVLVSPSADPANTVLQESRELKEGHALLLTNLVPETAYVYEVQIEDGVPNRSNPVTGGFLTEAAPDIAPPVVEGPFVEGVGSDGATVVFRTDEPSTGEVDFQVTEDGGESAAGELRGKIVLTDLAREHRVQLTQLATDRDYVVQVVAQDGAQPAPNRSQQQQATFHTRRKPDTEPPQKVIGPEIVEVTPTRALLEVTYNEPVELEVRYSINADLSGAMMRTLTTRQKSHAVELVGLERETRYYVRLLARDAAGLEGALLQTELVTPLKEDGTPPRFVAMPVAIEVLSSSARVGFAVDEPVTAEMIISPNGDLSDPLSVERSTERSTEQELRVSGLQPRQTYYFRVTATNGGGQTAVGEGDFTTTADKPKLTPRGGVGPA